MSGITDNGNPPLQWQFSLQTGDSSEPSDEHEWANHRYAPSKSGRRSLETSRDEEEKRKAEIYSPRHGYAALIVEMEKVKREVLNHSRVLNALQEEGNHLESCSSSGCVLQRLLHRMGLRMQAGLRTMSCLTGKREAGDSEQSYKVKTGDGIHIDTMKVRVECTLKKFECIARNLKSSSAQARMVFAPDFLYTQLPSQSTCDFRIMFKTFGDLATAVGVTAFSDLMEMVRKCGTGPQGDILRILGTYKYDSESMRSAATIYLGISCGDNHTNTTILGAVETSQRSTENSTPVLERKSREWNQVDRCFKFPLVLKQAPLPTLTESCSKVQAFTMEWKRASDLGSRTWSRSMAEPAQVFGWLELKLPFIQVEAHYLCQEVGGLAADDQWESLLSRNVVDQR